MCISNIFCRTTQNWVELTGWEMYESYADENCIFPGTMVNSNMLNIRMDEKEDANNNKRNMALEKSELKDK